VEPPEETLDLSMLHSLGELNVPGETDAVTELVELFLKNAVPLRDRLLETRRRVTWPASPRRPQPERERRRIGGPTSFAVVRRPRGLAKTGDSAGVQRASTI